jgi:flagellar biosynthesis component FlhA
VGTWLDDDGAAAAADHGLALLDPLAGVVWQLDGLARVHLARFIGLTEVELRLREWEMEGGEHRCDIVGLALPRKAARVRMVSLMRRLVRAQVAVHDLEAILRAVAAQSRDATVADLADAVRSRLMRSLPGVRDRRPHVTVPDDVQTAFVTAAASRSAPALDAAARSLMDCVRAAGLPTAPGAFVFVSSSAHARRAIQDSMDWRVPALAVVSEDELAAAAHRAPLGLRRVPEVTA